MENNSSNSSSKNKNGRNRILFLSSILLSILLLGGGVKAGYIPNYLDIKILCPEEDSTESTDDNLLKKPVIYLYPEQKQDIKVQLNYKGELIATYPEYNQKIGGWNITAYPDGRLINSLDKREYSYIFWEGQPKEKIDWDFSKGFVVKGKDVKEFLQKTLSQIGLTPKEYNEFIVYWFPLMQNNTYNLIHFAAEQYTDTAPLNITPKPDSILRVFMVYKPIEKPINIEKQEIQSFERKGFTVIEWGGALSE